MLIRGSFTRVAVRLLLLAALCLCAVPDLARAATVSLRQAGTTNTAIFAAPGAPLSLELLLDTGGLSFEWYFLGLDFTGGTISGASVTHQELGLSADFLGTPIIDSGAGTIRKINQSSFSTSLAAGVYVLDLIGFNVGTFGPTGMITVTPGLFDEFLGLDGGICPDADCTVGFGSLTITQAPEPSLFALVATALATLLVVRSRRART